MLELLIAHRVLQRPDGVLHKNVNLASIFQEGRDIRTGFVNPVVDRGLNFLAQGDHIGSGHDCI